MLFSPDNAEKVMRGKKTQTRRPVKEGEALVEGAARHKYRTTVVRTTEKERFIQGGFYSHSKTVSVRAERLKWQVGKTYAVQPGRGKPGIGRIRLLSIRRERVQDVTSDDAAAEGINISPLDAGSFVFVGVVYCAEFAILWDEVHGDGAWERNDEVWVLEFELVEDGDA